MRLSIRWRLTLWNTLALAVLLLGFSVLVYALMAHALYEQVDRALLAEAEQLRRDDRLQSQPEKRLAVLDRRVPGAREVLLRRLRRRGTGLSQDHRTGRQQRPRRPPGQARMERSSAIRRCRHSADSGHWPPDCARAIRT